MDTAPGMDKLEPVDMPTVSLELEVSEAEALLAQLREYKEMLSREYEEAYERMAKIKEQYSHLEGRIKSISASLSPNGVVDITVQRSESGRAPRGESERIITTFLKGRNGTGATLQEICEHTKAVYGTVRRIVLALESQELVEKMEDSHWRWRTQGSQQ